jgi:hypothetical protein
MSHLFCFQILSRNESGFCVIFSYLYHLFEEPRKREFQKQD